ncbi:hypothetical protein TWF594_007119 [Orbilia oligospora]|nr:hypothetical protein TWF706_008947 [Orbilia oligospora]KAF3151477.1 hypothetical protein TWF594_007119 [Orbilia oligospora]
MQCNGDDNMIKKAYKLTASEEPGKELFLKRVILSTSKPLDGIWCQTRQPIMMINSRTTLSYPEMLASTQWTARLGSLGSPCGEGGMARICCTSSILEATFQQVHSHTHSECKTLILRVGMTRDRRGLVRRRKAVKAYVSDNATRKAPYKYKANLVSAMRYLSKC